MAGGVGQLSVGLNLDYAAYTAGLTKAQAQAQQFATNFKASFGGNLAAGFTRDIIKGLADIPGRLVNVVKGAIDAADHLNDLSKSTGVAVETLGGIGFAASQAGSSLDGTASAIGKLNITLAKAASGNKEAGDALRALGVTALDPLTGKTIDVDKALVQMANTFEKTGDSPEKFRAAAAALGKQYQELVPLLADGGKALLANIAYYQRFAGVSTETAEKADAFNDTLGKINLLTGAFSRTLAAELLTPLSGIAQAFLTAKEKGDGFKGTVGTIKEGLIGIATTASFVVNSLEAIGASVSGIVQKAEILSDFASKQRAETKNPLDIFGTGSFSFDKLRGLGKEFDKVDADTKKRRDKAQSDFDAFSKLIRDGADLPAGPKKSGRVPGIPDASQAAEAEAALKRNLDGLLRTIKLETDAQQSALAFASRFLEGEYQDGLVSLQNYYDDQSNIRKRALQVQIEEQDRIIAAEKAFRDATKNPASKIEATNRIADAGQAKTRVTIDTQQADALAKQQRERAVRDLAKAFEGVNAQVLDLRENFAAAAEIKFDLQFDALKRTFTAEGNEAGKEAIKTLRAATIAQAEFQKAALETSRTFEDLANKEARIAILEQTGALTSLEALAKVGDARRAQIAILERQVAAEETLAAIEKAKGTAGADELVRKAEAGRIALDKLKASADPLAESLNKVFGQEFNSALDEFVTSTKSASEAFKDFGKSVLDTILKMGTKSLTEEIFGGSGGAGGFISDLFKNSGQTGGLVAAIKGAFGGGTTGGDLGESGGVPTASAVDAITKLFSDSGATAAKAAETAASSASTAAITALATAATAAATALSAMAAASAASTATDTASSAGDIASLFTDFGGFFASGGTIKPGKWGVVGENGPELAFGGSTGKTILPMSDAQSSSSGGRTVNLTQNFHVTAPASRDTQQQVFAAAYEGAAQAYGRNS